MKRIPASGIVGLAALKEAASTEYVQVMHLVRAALQARYDAAKPANASYAWFDIEAMFADRVIVCKDGRYWKFPYSIDDKNAVVLAEPVEVLETFTDVALKEALAAGAVLVESKDEGKTWDVVIVRAGASGNGNYYTDAALRESAAAFEGAKVYAKSNAEHLREGAKPDINTLAGWISDARFVEGKSVDSGHLAGRLNFSGKAELRETIADAWKRGKKNLVGLSIDAIGKTVAAKGAQLREGVKRVVQSILKVRSVDLIVDPAAGGALVRLVEATDTKEQDPMKDLMLAAIKAKRPNADLSNLTEAQILELYGEVLKESAAPAGNAVTREELQSYQRLVEARGAACARIEATTLPAPSKARLAARVGATEDLAELTEAKVDELVKAERADVVALLEAAGVDAGKVRIAAGDIVVEDRPKKMAAMFDAFFNPGGKDGEGKPYPRVHSFKECYIEVTGDTRVTGRIEHANRARLAESLGLASLRESLDTTAFSDVLGATLRRTLVADYRRPNQYDVWRQIVNIVPVADFRTNERTRFGGYGDLPAVAESGAYLALSSPTDEKATYAVSKKGGTEDITLEMIKNDDVGAIRRIPMALSRAAKRTVAKLVLDLIRTNPTLYDSVAFFHGTHANLGSAALDATSLAAARLRMLKQAEADSSDRLGIPPKFLLVPADLEQTAVDLFKLATNNDKTFIADLSLTVLPVWYWTDANDWAIGADPMECPSIEVGFLDGNEEPELFVQDNPTVGSMFSNDKLTYKIRQIVGAQVINFRGFDKSVVA